ncbi:MAG: hypothetical protein IJH99_04220 [Eubacterium sp.]|nr:hypothetical protein [Eubacterium sp.]
MNRKWKNEYPAMPESFHAALLESLSLDEAEASAVRRTAGKGKRAMIGVAVAAAAVLAAAGVYKGLATFYPSSFLTDSAREGTEYGILSEMKEAQQRTDVSPEMQYVQAELPAFPEEEDILRVAEVKSDGIELFAVLEKTNAAKGYDIALKELYIDDVRNEEMPAYTNEDEDTFAFRADISKKDTGNSFKVTVIVNVYGRDGTRYRNQELSFWVTGGKGVEHKLAGPQTFVHDECTVTVLSAMASANCLRLEIEAEGLCIPDETEGIHFAVQSENGEEFNVLDGKRTFTEDGFSDVLILSGYKEIPARICLVCRIGQKGEAYTLFPAAYEDWIDLE